MEITIEKLNDINAICLSGNLTIASAQDLFSQVISILEKGGKKFLFDVSAMGSIDSMGLGTMVRIAKRIKEANARLKLSNLNPNVLKLFEVTNLTQVFDIYETREKALKDF